MRKITIYGLRLPEVRFGDDLAKLIVRCARESGVDIVDGDVIVVTSKLISKAYGFVKKVSDIKPSLTSRIISRILGKPAWEVELILKLCDRVVFVIPVYDVLRNVDRLNIISSRVRNALDVISRDRCLLLVNVGGRLATDVGIDMSNLPKGYAAFLPSNLKYYADLIRRDIEKLTGRRVAVVISDTEGLFFKLGSTDIAVAYSGIRPIAKMFGELDRYGKPKFGGVDFIVDEICSAAALLMGQTSESIPVVIIRGLKYDVEEIPSSKLYFNRRDLGLAFIKGLILTLIVKFILIFRSLFSFFSKLLR